MDIDTLQSLDSKGIARKHLSSKLHVGDVGKLFLMSANALCMVRMPIGYAIYTLLVTVIFLERWQN